MKKIKMGIDLSFGDFKGDIELKEGGGEIVCDRAIVVLQDKKGDEVTQSVMTISGDTQKKMKTEDVIQALVMTIKVTGEKTADPLFKAFCGLVYDAYSEAIEIRAALDALAQQKEGGFIKDFDGEEPRWN